MTGRDSERRVRAAAGLVVRSHDYAASFSQAPNFDATARAMTALSMWQLMTDIDDPDVALRAARELADGGE